jgi:hypothetical protein
MDWVIESSSSAQSAFRSGIASSVYAANNFAGLPRGTKVIPLGTPARPSTTTSSVAAPAVRPLPGGAGAPGSAGRVLAGSRPLSQIATGHVGRRVILAKVQVGGRRGTLRFIATIKRTVVGRCVIGRVGARKTVTCKIRMKRPYPLKRVRFTVRFRSVTGTVALRQAWVVR